MESTKTIFTAARYRKTYQDRKNGPYILQYI